jgi:hypothetical protein
VRAIKNPKRNKIVGDERNKWTLYYTHTARRIEDKRRRTKRPIAEHLYIGEM